MKMKTFGLTVACILLLSSLSMAQVETDNNSRFEAAIISKSLSQQGSDPNALVGLEVSIYNRNHTFSISAFALTSFNRTSDNARITAGFDSPLTTLTRDNFSSAGFSFQRLLLSKNRINLSVSSALALNWFDQIERDSDVISYGPNAFTSFEPGINFSYDITNRFAFKVTPSYLIILESENSASSFQRLNIGAGLSIRF